MRVISVASHVGGLATGNMADSRMPGWLGYLYGWLLDGWLARCVVA